MDVEKQGYQRGLAGLEESRQGLNCRGINTICTVACYGQACDRQFGSSWDSVVSRGYNIVIDFKDSMCDMLRMDIWGFKYEGSHRIRSSAVAVG